MMKNTSIKLQKKISRGCIPITPIKAYAAQRINGGLKLTEVLVVARSHYGLQWCYAVCPGKSREIIKRFRKWDLHDKTTYDRHRETDPFAVVSEHRSNPFGSVMI